MSRFFKSAAFPILIVVVLAFFAQKLIGNSSHEPQLRRSATCSTQLEQDQVKSLSIQTKDNTVDVTTDAAARSTRSAIPTTTRRR